MQQLPIYLDHHSSTPLDPRVLDAMMPFLTTDFGNAAAESHAYGWRAEDAVELARRRVAELIGAHPKEVIFTSCATESNNAAIKGMLDRQSSSIHFVTSAIEHASIIDTGQALARKGVPVTFVKPDLEGIVHAVDVSQEIYGNKSLVSVMFANNEIGTINPVAEIAKSVHAHGAIFHCDMVQAVGRVPIDVHRLGIDLASLSAHKIYGPKGVGAIFIRRELQDQLQPLIHGGGHERNLRAGSLNVPAIVGFGVACVLMQQEMVADNQRILRLRERLRLGLQEALPEASVNGSLEQRLAGNLNMSFGAIDGQRLLLAIQRSVAISQGASCSSADCRVSHVLSALGLSAAMAQATIRFGIGRFNTEEEIDICIQVLIREVRRLK